MDGLWTTLFGKALSDCGLLNLFTLLCLVGVCTWSVKTTSAREKERQEVEKARQAERTKFLELQNDSNEIIRDLSVAVETMKGTLMVLGYNKK